MKKQTKKVAIVIPFHKKNLSQDEEISVNHLNKFLSNFDKFLVLPALIKRVSFNIPNAKIINFPKEYFTSIPKYCELLNTRIFYEKFESFEYILIYQLDVLVFSNQLLNLCRKRFDYMGAPFFNPIIGRLSYRTKKDLYGGNGGFSLRKVSSFLKIISQVESLAKRTSSNPFIRKLWFLQAVLSGKSHKIWLNAPPKDYPFNEDGFWSYEASKYAGEFKVAPLKEALKFSFESNPKKCFKLNKYKLPFGCHAWKKFDETFWKPYILKRKSS